MIATVLVGWCEIHALIYASLLILAFWGVQWAWLIGADRQPEPPPAPDVHTPSWATTSHHTPKDTR